MIRIKYFITVVLILSISAIAIGFKDYKAYINIREINKSLENSQITSKNIRNLSYSPTIKSLVGHDGINITKIEASKGSEDFTMVQIEYEGEIKRGNEIFNNISIDPKIKSIKNIVISNEDDNIKIKAEIHYLSNIICK